MPLCLSAERTPPSPPLRSGSTSPFLRNGEETGARAIVARAAWRRASHEAQQAPEGGWRTWVFLGGRGAGKTRAGASPDRADALVWAVTDLLIDRAGARPRARAA
jgi:phage terminase large subunit-like protein